MSVPDGNVAGDRLIAIGRTFFGLALLGLGAEHFVFRYVRDRPGTGLV